MGAVRLLRTLAPLALVAGLATACGSSSSSGSASPTGDGSSTPVTASSVFELRPVYARYAPGVPLGPQIPQDLLKTISHTSCPIKPQDIQGMLLECDAGKTVYLLKPPIVSGAVASATPKQVGHGPLWFVQITLDPSAKAALDSAVSSMTGTELAYSVKGSVVTSVIIGTSFSTDKLALTGDFDKAQATKLAGQVSGSA